MSDVRQETPRARGNAASRSFFWGFPVSAVPSLRGTKQSQTDAYSLRSFYFTQRRRGAETQSNLKLILIRYAQFTSHRVAETQRHSQFPPRPIPLTKGVAACSFSGMMTGDSFLTLPLFSLIPFSSHRDARQSQTDAYLLRSAYFTQRRRGAETQGNLKLVLIRYARFTSRRGAEKQRQKR
jgi:hypothetical protein